MAQLFNDNDGDFLSRADITTARFISAQTWTLCAFFRIEDSAGDQRGIVSKWAAGGSTQQFFLRTAQGTAPQAIECTTDDDAASPALIFGTVDLNTWYLVVIRNDGTGGAGGFKGDLFNMDGTVDGGTTTTHEGDSSDLTTQIAIGHREATGDAFDGDIAYVAYFNTELTDAEVLAYLRNPYAVVFSKGSTGVEFFLPMYGDASPEPELVHGRDFTSNGSQVKGTNPPLGPFVAPFVSSLRSSAPAFNIARHALLGYVVPQ